ncbi:hypothetical protein HHK36_017730 [Tetracentron sinense]|uniref:Sm domain-containing protein n=1 Tax=Tetracentron sinense TaxID=13715 RepID=A0A835DA66_TETSI|nr:hypothetical protein HHK36_017730 [Tetracentron sinense]
MGLCGLANYASYYLNHYTLFLFQSGRKETVLDLAKFVDKGVQVKLTGGRQVTGTLKGYDQLLNLVLDEAIEFLREDERQAISRYRMGLKMEIKKELTTIRLTNLEEAYELALKIEAQLRHPTLKRIGVVVEGFSTSQNASSAPCSNVSTSNSPLINKFNSPKPFGGDSNKGKTPVKYITL